MMTWLKFDKIDGNTCKSCSQTGISQYHECDGMTIYSWQKPKIKPCEHCHSDEHNLYCLGYTVHINGKDIRK